MNIEQGIMKLTPSTFPDKRDQNLSHHWGINVQKIICIVERLRLRSSNRLTVNVIRNQQRNRRTLNATSIASLEAMEYYSHSRLGGIGLSIKRRTRKVKLCQIQEVKNYGTL